MVTRTRTDSRGRKSPLGNFKQTTCRRTGDSVFDITYYPTTRTNCATNEREYMLETVTKTDGSGANDIPAGWTFDCERDSNFVPGL